MLYQKYQQENYELELVPHSSGKASQHPVSKMAVNVYRGAVSGDMAGFQLQQPLKLGMY